MANKIISLSKQISYKGLQQVKSRYVGTIRIKENGRAFLAPAFNFSQLDQDTYYKIHLSLLNSGLDVTLDDHRHIADGLFKQVFMAKHPGTSKVAFDASLRHEIFSNTYHLFIKKVKRLLSGQTLPYQLVADKNVSYNHTDLFSQVYHHTVNCIQETINHHGYSNVIDLGAGRSYIAALLDQIFKKMIKYWSHQPK